MEPLVSVIIPTYNRRRFICETVDSVLAQTHRNLEVIVVDDGSTDGTGDLLKARYSNEPRFRYIWQENAERSVARNRGFHASRGEYVAFLDADDLWLPQKLESQLNCFTVHPETVLVYCDCAYIDENGKRLRWPPHSVEGEKPGRIFWEMIEKGLIHPATPVIRREIFAVAGGFRTGPEIIRAEDWELFTRLCYLGPVGYVPEVLALYRVHPGNTGRPLLPYVYRAMVKSWLQFVRLEDRRRVRETALSTFWRLYRHADERDGWQGRWEAAWHATATVGSLFWRRLLARPDLLSRLVLGEQLTQLAFSLWEKAHRWTFPQH